MEQKALQVGTVVVLLALLLRLAATRQEFAKEVGSTLLFLSSGRMVTETLPPETTQPAQPTQVSGESEEIAVPVFGQEDIVQLSSPWEVDQLSLLQTPLHWDLRGETPSVLILHTHATESFENTQGYQESSAYRTLDEEYNMVAVGREVTRLLEEAGISVIHDTTYHDYPTYNDAYANARQTIAHHLQENPGICLVLDLHRDAAEDQNGRQVAQTVQVNGEETARLMLVMGTDKGSLSHEQWQKNLSLAVKLQAQLERDYSGLCKPIQLVTARYNQDLSTGSLLVEVGSAGNTQAQAMQAAKYLAQGIIALADGANI